MTPLDALPNAIRSVAPNLNASATSAWAAALSSPMQASGIITPNRIAMFLGQCAVESGDFTRLVEDLNYSSERLRVVWPARFPTAASAAAVAHNPEALANLVYANRLGNGDATSGDGWLFRGRGLLQTTGRANYSSLSVALRMDISALLPWLETPTGAARSACYYWATKGCNGFADRWDVEGCTRRINGGDTDLQDRIVACARALGACRAAEKALFLASDGERAPPEINGSAPSSAKAGTPVQEQATADDLNQQELNRVKGA